MGPTISPALLELLQAFGVTLDNTLGFLFISFTVSVFLLGLLTFQVHHFYLNYSNDPVSTKIVVRSFVPF
jgi:hypothetical protein